MRIICDEKKNEKSDVCDDDDGGDRPSDPTSASTPGGTPDTTSYEAPPS